MTGLIAFPARMQDTISDATPQAALHSGPSRAEQRNSGRFSKVMRKAPPAKVSASLHSHPITTETAQQSAANTSYFSPMFFFIIKNLLPLQAYSRKRRSYYLPRLPRGAGINLRSLPYEAGCRAQTANKSFSSGRQLPVPPALYEWTLTLRYRQIIAPQGSRVNGFFGKRS